MSTRLSIDFSTLSLNIINLGEKFWIQQWTDKNPVYPTIILKVCLRLVQWLQIEMLKTITNGQNGKQWICFFIYTVVLRPNRTFFTYMQSSSIPGKGFKFWLILGTQALMAIEQWCFFNVPRLLWHRSSVYNVHLRGPVTLAPKRTMNMRWSEKVI